MATPVSRDWDRLKRMGRCLKARPRLIQKFRWQEWHDVVEVDGDTDYAGCTESRKSTSGGCVFWGKHYLKYWSKTQATIALSSGESELMGMVKAASEGLGVTALMRDLGIEVTGTVATDSAAALGIASRQGLGKVRHLDVNLLWVQQQ